LWSTEEVEEDEELEEEIRFLGFKSRFITTNETIRSRRVEFGSGHGDWVRCPFMIVRGEYHSHGCGEWQDLHAVAEHMVR
jgi:hypothetical protein